VCGERFTTRVDRDVHVHAVGGGGCAKRARSLFVVAGQNGGRTTTAGVVGSYRPGDADADHQQHGDNNDSNNNNSNNNSNNNNHSSSLAPPPLLYASRGRSTSDPDDHHGTHSGPGHNDVIMSPALHMLATCRACGRVAEPARIEGHEPRCARRLLERRLASAVWLTVAAAGRERRAVVFVRHAPPSDVPRDTSDAHGTRPSVGDRLVSIGGHELADIADLPAATRALVPGTWADVVYVPGAESRSVVWRIYVGAKGRNVRALETLHRIVNESIKR
jgi:hypothetical protein